MLTFSSDNIHDVCESKDRFFISKYSRLEDGNCCRPRFGSEKWARVSTSAGGKLKKTLAIEKIYRRAHALKADGGHGEIIGR